ncbi:hypothetical protein FF38_01871 [Lucilia cuprina]|uniref:Uncharacterized protein n=1 Tax=Lucilia cuprina TaxID=7375 RepID=A0A0L0BQF7_LUCCU|nr:hypothetical protein FF38_01871 [Lucilia cuprina]
MVRPNEHIRGIKIEPKNLNKKKEEEVADRNDVQCDERVVELDTTAFRDRTSEDEQILTDCNEDDLLGLSKDSFGESGATQKFGEMDLSSDGEQNTTVVSAHGRMTESSPPTDVAKEDQCSLSEEGRPHGVKNANLVRQAAEELPRAPPRDLANADGAERSGVVLIKGEVPRQEAQA